MQALKTLNPFELTCTHYTYYTYFHMGSLTSVPRGTTWHWCLRTFHGVIHQLLTQIYEGCWSFCKKNLRIFCFQKTL